MSSPRVLAVVPARGGSKGLPGKNLRPLAGLPLVAHSLRAAAAMRTVTRCIVSTDDPQVARVAREHGGDVPWLRPAELATDTTPMAPVLRHALAAVEEEEGRPYDALVLLDPTSPARVPAEVDAAVEQLLALPRPRRGHLGVAAVVQPGLGRGAPVGARSRACSSATSPRGPGSPVARTPPATCGSTAPSTSGPRRSCGAWRTRGSTRAGTAWSRSPSGGPTPSTTSRSSRTSRRRWRAGASSCRGSPILTTVRRLRPPAWHDVPRAPGRTRNDA